MVIEVQNLSKHYGDTVALKDISLIIERGGIVGLLGPNGAGKTTFMETLQGLRLPSSGSVRVLGLDPTRQGRQLKELIGVQLQSTAIPEELTPLETLKLFAALFSKSLPPQDVLARVGLSAKAAKRNSTLSGGQRQRLSIGMALVNDPELVILDEPSSGLDPEARREIHDYISDLRARKKTVLLSTQSMEEAQKLCNRVVLLHSGKVVADGNPAELISRAAESAVLSVVLAGQFDPSPLLLAGAISGRPSAEHGSFTSTNPKTMIAALASVLQVPGAILVDMHMKTPTLEDVYLSLVRKAARNHREDA